MDQSEIDAKLESLKSAPDISELVEVVAAMNELHKNKPAEIPEWGGVIRTDAGGRVIS